MAFGSHRVESGPISSVVSVPLTGGRECSVWYLAIFRAYLQTGTSCWKKQIQRNLVTSFSGNKPGNCHWACTILTQRESVELRSQRHMSYPSKWINTNISRSYWRIKNVRFDWIAVLVSNKHLLTWSNKNLVSNSAYTPLRVLNNFIIWDNEVAAIKP